MIALSEKQWAAIRNRYDEITQQLASAGQIEKNKRHVLQKEHAHLAIVINKANEIDALQKLLIQTNADAADTTDDELKKLFEQEAADLAEQIDQKNRELDQIIAPANELDERSIYLEIRAGTGGQEAALFASDLLKMYTNYALKKGWKVSIESESFTDLGGYREVVLHIKGKGVYGTLKQESGVHRVQRVPATETAGRVHTSTATVAVLPEAEDVEVSISPQDLRIDVFRASGAGGQHVNTTDSAVRITHIPTGLVVSCQDERSQHKNKAKAMKILQSRLLAAQQEAQAQAMSQQRKELVGGGMRAEKVRTYNYPQNRITDHQVDLTLNKLDIIMQGALDEIIDALRKKEHHDRAQQFLARFA